MAARKVLIRFAVVALGGVVASVVNAAPPSVRKTCTLLLVFFCLTWSLAAAAQDSLTVEPAGAVTWDRMLAAEARAPRAAARVRAIPFMPGPGVRELGAHGPLAAAPTLGPGPAPLGPTVTANFAALDDNNTIVPPDTMGAAGPSHLMTMLNSQVRIQDKTGGIMSTVSFSTFWTSGTGLSGTPFDPHVLYDSVSGRWIATVNADARSATSKVWFAMSATNDPTGAWTFYQFVADGTGSTWADYQGFGVNNTWIAITKNMYRVHGGQLVGAKMWVIDKSAALMGGPLTVTVFSPGFDTSGGVNGSTLKPALTYSAAEPTLFIVDNSGWTSGGTALIRLSRITGTGAAPAWSVVPGSSFTGPSPGPTGLFAVANNFSFTQIQAPQFGTSATIDTGDTRASDSVYRNGGLWFAHSGGLPSSGTVNRTAVFWYQVDPSAMPSPIVQSGVLDGGAGVHHFFPSIAANAANDALLGFSRSDASRFVEAVTAGRFEGDPLGSMAGPSVLKAGEGCYLKTFGGRVNRWGDYSASSIDPTDDLTFWTVQEYATIPSPATSCADNSGRWGTWWGMSAATTTTTSSTTSTSSTTTTTITGCG